MEIENKLKPIKYEIIRIKFAIIGDKGSGKSTFIETFKECYKSTKLPQIKNNKGTLIKDNNKPNRIYDVVFDEIDDLDRHIVHLRKVHCIFIASSLEKKEYYNSVIKVLRLFTEKRVENVDIILVGNIFSNKKTYLDEVELINNDYQEVIKDFDKELRIKYFIAVNFTDQKQIYSLINNAISGLNLEVKDECLGEGYTCSIF